MTERPAETGTVLALNHDGEGIVKSGKTAFVAGALPGETITFVRGRRHRQYDEARVVDVIEPSPQRVTPRCAHFGVCGGCAMQHLAPSAALAAKQAELREGLFRIGRVEPRTWLPPLVGPEWNYRRRARLGARYVAKKGRVLVGFRERAAPYVADCRRCEILVTPMDALLEPLAELLDGLSIRERLPQIEVAVGDRATVLVLRTLDPPSADDVARLRAFELRHRLRFYLQPAGLDSIVPLTSDAEIGPDGPSRELDYSLPEFGLTLSFLPTDFVQVNGDINRALVARAVELLDVQPEDRVLDLFCGLGNFTLALARRARQVTGVEGDAGLIERARANAVRNGLTNADFHVANLAQNFDQTPGQALPWARQGYDKVLLDPPRAGAREILPTLARFRPSRILYISCHPGSLARDVGILVHEHGFTLHAAGVLDMFPHTTHVESVAVLEPDGG